MHTYTDQRRYYLPRQISRHVDYITPGVALSPPLKKSIVKRNMRPQPNSPWPQRLIPPWHQQPHNMPPAAAELPEDLQTCGRNITPACIRALYDIPIQSSNALTNNTANTVGVFETLNYYNQSDLDSFFAQYAPNIPTGTHPVVNLINGAIVDQDSYVRRESDIDLDSYTPWSTPKPSRRSNAWTE